MDDHEHDDMQPSEDDLRRVHELRDKIEERFQEKGFYLDFFNVMANVEVDEEEAKAGVALLDVPDRGMLVLQVAFSVGDVAFTDRNFVSQSERDTMRAMQADVGDEATLLRDSLREKLSKGDGSDIMDLFD